MASCLTCSSLLSSQQAKFCSKKCYFEALRLGMISNKGMFQKGQASPNKGRTLESWVGPERALEIRKKMSKLSKLKAESLRRLNSDQTILEMRVVSRKHHEEVVRLIIEELRSLGYRCFTLSEYVREKRIPDAIIFDGLRLTALEVEQEKRYKPSHESMTLRLSHLNSLAQFFDGTIVVFPDSKAEPGSIAHQLLSEILARKELLRGNPGGQSKEV